MTAVAMKEGTERKEQTWWDAVAMHEEGDGVGKKTRWTRVGKAFTNRDGSYTIYLDALPTGGKMQIRPPREERLLAPQQRQGKSEAWTEAPGVAGLKRVREVAR